MLGQSQSISSQHYHNLNFSFIASHNFITCIDYYNISYQKKTCTHDDQSSQQDIHLEGTTKVVHKKHVDYVYFGIFDGHGGKHAAEFAQSNLLHFIVRQDDFWKSDDESILNAIKKGFLDTHMAMLDSLPCWPKTIRNLPSTSGTTASVLFIKNGKYYTGHVGDSRIVLGSENTETKQWIGQSLTVDHKPESPEEKKRIQEAGGAVHNKSGVDRVVWQKPILRFNYDYHESLIPKVYPIQQNAVQGYACIPFLAVARSLGDLWSINTTTGKYVVSPEPDVAVRPISPNDKTIILASDGLWNMVSSADAVRLTQELAKQVNRYMLEDFYIADEEDIAKSLVYYAYQQWTSRNLRSDNTSAVVVLLEEAQKFTDPSSNDVLVDNCIDCSCNCANYGDKVVKEEKPLSLGDRFRFRGSFDLIGFRTEYPDFPVEESEYYEQEAILRGMMSVPPIQSKLRPPMSHSINSNADTRTLKLSDGNAVTIITLEEDLATSPKERNDLAVKRSVSKGKMIRNAYTQANRKQTQNPNVVRTESECNYRTDSTCVELMSNRSYSKKPVIPDVWSISSQSSKYEDDLVSSKKENAIITEIQKVVQRVSPSEVGSIKRKFDSTTFDSITIPGIVDKIASSPVKKSDDVIPLRYDMRRRMLESSNGENLNRSAPTLQGRPRKRIRVGSASPTSTSSKYSPPHRHLRSLSLRRSSIQTHPQTNKQHKQSMKSQPRGTMLNRPNKAIARLRPRHRLSRRSG